MRILFLGMAESVRTARSINQVADLGWDLHLFSATTAAPHHDLRNTTVYKPPVDVQNNKYIVLVAEVESVLRELLFPDLPVSDRRTELLAGL